jgi:hypothetical protein
VHACGGRAASGRFGCYAADGRGAEEVCWGYEVVRMPLLMLALRDWWEVVKLAMSSGSSGKRVMVPEPSLSMFWLIRRILSFV